MMGRARRICILIIKVNKLFSFLSSWCFLDEIENMFSVFLSSYRNTRESLGELKKLWKHSPFLSLSNFHSCFYNAIETLHVFYFLDVKVTRACEPSGSSGQSLFQFCSIKLLRVSQLPPGWDASPLQGYPQH